MYLPVCATLFMLDRVTVAFTVVTDACSIKLPVLMFEANGVGPFLRRWHAQLFVLRVEMLQHLEVL